ncbi:FMN reductase [Pseudorhodoferax sp. Leaf274]|uniref:FMN reductase n=1 Tax=Pseudorhodoferax sp. Leaf274 TaxID=1736318 RepID=UPI0007031365|nr:FMN reductase [Pseudorhodoferax sp. Leaf274]KQP49838.1 FMN reductase [Pseudorhodoferax sp. Leaf274]
MSTPIDIVAVVGSTTQPSRTRALVDALAETLEQHLLARVRVVQLGDFARLLGQALSREELPAEVEDHLRAIETADLLIAATPVYRGSFTGHFKHLFDLVGQDALIDKPVLLAATGGSDRHALVLDHQLRPLFSFFQALTLPIGVYGSNAEFENYQVTHPALKARVKLAVDRALPLFAAHQRPQLRRAA